MTVTSFRALVAGYTPTPLKPAPATGERAGTVVITRIRPAEDEDADPHAVFARTEDPESSENSENAENTENTVATVVDLHELKTSVRGDARLQSSSFTLDGVYGPAATTEQLYARHIARLVPWAWNGGVGTVFAYGQTGSGKTYTVSAIEQLVARDLFRPDEERGFGGQRKVYLSIVELAGNAACDLLNSRRAVSILEDSFGVTQLNGAHEAAVETEAEMLALIETATALRRTAATEKNAASSRSHAICRIRFQNVDMPTAEDGTLFLIDLAGSEAARDSSQHDAQRMRETREINASLSVLKDCIRGKAEADALALTGSRKKPHVPFRQSALTKVLKHVFDPAAASSGLTLVVACINPCLGDIGSSKNTLRYAETLRVMVPKTRPAKYDPAVPTTWTNAQLRDWIAESSGTPPVDAAVLAPTESGLQLLRLPEAEFEARCMRTPGVGREQAAAVRAKFWALHADSRNGAKAKSAAAAEGAGGDVDEHEPFRASSRPKKSAAAIPFTERIVPGMVVAWTPPDSFKFKLPGMLNLVLVLCPAAAAGDAVDAMGAKMSAAKEDEGPAYACAMVTPGMMPNAYEVNLWHQVVVPVARMDKEVILEYDVGTRYYFMTV